MSILQKKKEKFINTFFEGLDDPVMETIFRIVHLGEPEEKLNEVIEAERKKIEEMYSAFELTDVSQTVLTEEERKAIISQNTVEPEPQDDNGDSSTDSTTASNKGHTDVSPEYPTNHWVSAER